MAPPQPLKGNAFFFCQRIHHFNLIPVVTVFLSFFFPPSPAADNSALVQLFPALSCRSLPFLQFWKEVALCHLS